jgi:hypoxanthine-guanine phosphoribosyltransferase
MREAEEDKFRNDSLVSEVLGEYEIIFKNKNKDDMPLEYFMERIKKIALMLKDKAMLKASPNKATKAFGYAPDAIVGISNGGMVFADLLHRANIYKQHKCAFYSLWASRDHPGKYFHSNANECMLKGIMEDVKKPAEDVRLLLVDDNVSGGDTSKQAITFIRDKIPGVHVRFLPLFFNREDILDRIETDILWTHRAFNIGREDILGLHFVNYQRFPYDKPISGH